MVRHRYCADLFGIEGPEASAVADALSIIVGTSSDSAGFHVHWSLRRIVSRAV